MFWDRSNPRICQKCDDNCRTCVNSSTTCISCPNSTNGQMFLTPSATCNYVCPVSSFLNTSVCVRCDSSCLTCWGALSTQCSRCNNITSRNGSITIYYLISGTSTCSNVCIDGQYIDSNVPNYCQLCSSTCLTCINSSSNCVNCQTGSYYFNGVCLPTCVAGYYGKIITLSC